MCGRLAGPLDGEEGRGLLRRGHRTGRLAVGLGLVRRVAHGGPVRGLLNHHLLHVRPRHHGLWPAARPHHGARGVSAHGRRPWAWGIEGDGSSRRPLHHGRTTGPGAGRHGRVLWRTRARGMHPWIPASTRGATEQGIEGPKETPVQYALARMHIFACYLLRKPFNSSVQRLSSSVHDPTMCTRTG